MTYVIEPPETAAVPVEGGGLFPVHRIYCVGRNYAAHALEMGGDPNREEPFFFQKNADSLVTQGGDFPYPSKSKDVHHEIELVVALSTGGDNIPLSDALNCVFGYAVGLDMTRRDLQGECKKHGIRAVGAHRHYHAGERQRTSGGGRHLAQGRWENSARGEPEPADLEGAGDHLLSFRLLHAEAGRSDHDGDPFGRGGCRARKCASWPCRWRRRSAHQGRLAGC
jgi:Fumarylacetoacetate (FAA) hydrolase family